MTSVLAARASRLPFRSIVCPVKTWVVLVPAASVNVSVTVYVPLRA
jgi:hypothetical protein